MEWGRDAFAQAVTVSYIDHGNIPAGATVPGQIPDIRQSPGARLKDAARKASVVLPA